MELQIHEQYPLVVIAVNSGNSVIKAVATIGMSRSSFYKYRWMAEMKIVDSHHYEHLREQFRSAAKLSEECKAALADEDSFGVPAVGRDRTKSFFLFPNCYCLIELLLPI